MKPCKIQLEIHILGECTLCNVRILYDETKSNEIPRNPTKLYRYLQKTDSVSSLLNGRMQDAHEFLKKFVHIVDAKHPEVNVADMFNANILTEVKCLTCNTAYTNSEVVGDFIIDVEGKRSVEEALHSFFESENIEEYNCIMCMTSVSATKTNFAISTPECLLIVLNRTAKSNRNTKLNSDVYINEELIMKCLVNGKIQRWKYKLVSTVNHVGRSYNSGHYNTNILTGSKIYLFDDSTVRKQKKISGRNAYVLFYERFEVNFYELVMLTIQFCIRLLLTQEICVNEMEELILIHPKGEENFVAGTDKQTDYVHHDSKVFVVDLDRFQKD